MFMVGAAAGEVVFNVVGRFRGAAVPFAVSVLLRITHWLSETGTALTLALAMGALNAAMIKGGSACVCTTYVTEVLVKSGQMPAMADWPMRRRLVVAASSDVGEPACWHHHGRYGAATRRGAARAFAGGRLTAHSLRVMGPGWSFRSRNRQWRT